MTAPQAVPASERRPLRLWPALVILALHWLVLLVPPALGVPEVSPILVSMTAAGLVLLWWLFASRAAWTEKLLVVAVAAAGVAIVSPFVHPSIATGAMNRLTLFLAPPFVAHALVAGALLTSRWSSRLRPAALAAAVVLGAMLVLLIRTEGIRGGGFDLAWRWTPTAEQRLLAADSDVRDLAPPATVPAAAPETAAAANNDAAAASNPPDEAPPDGAASVPVALPALGVAWPGFRGADRDSVVSGTAIATDWTADPPEELWRRAVGPGWGSFAIAGNLIFTQEQRGPDETISAYRLKTGEPVWRHRDAARFYEGNAGPGPRSTPLVHDSRVYAMGATGIVNALDARTGARIWTRNAETDTGAPRPGWGFSGSPIVVNDLLVVAASGRVIAYDLATGEPRWKQSTGGGGYSSPHLVAMDGVPQILLTSGGGVTSLAPADGTILWQLPGGGGTSIVQPALTAPGEVLVAGGDMMGGTGIRRLAVSRAGGSWKTAESWATRGLKPYFNDFVVHDGQAYGFDGSILSCIDLRSGERCWKGGRYGQGQMLLLPDQDLLLVLSEDGEVVLVSATSERHREITRFKAIEGKTWNHPVLAGDLLLVRNGEEMAAFRLAAK